MALMDEKTRARVRERLTSSMAGPVELHLYRRSEEGGRACPTCDPAEEIARTLAELAPDRITLEVTEVGDGTADVESVPAITVSAPGQEAHIMFQGLPSGYEFATLLDAVERTSAGGEQLSATQAGRLAQLDGEIEVLVFVTPGCPYCPRAASMANRMALTSPRVRSLVVEAGEFPELAARFQVHGVPHTVVNRLGGFVGALPEAAFVDSVLGLARGEVA